MPELGKLLMIVGGTLLAIGIALTVAGRIPWLGRLPGDIVIERAQVRVYFPWVTCLLVSLALSFLLWLSRR